MKRPFHLHTYLSRRLTYRNAVMQNSNWVSFSWKIVLLRRLLLKIYQSLDVELQHKEFQSFFSLKSRALLILDVGLFAQSYWWRCISAGHGHIYWYFSIQLLWWYFNVIMREIFNSHDPPKETGGLQKLFFKNY